MNRREGELFVKFVVSSHMIRFRKRVESGKIILISHIASCHYHTPTKLKKSEELVISAAVGFCYIYVSMCVCVKKKHSSSSDCSELFFSLFQIQIVIVIVKLFTLPFSFLGA
jgi:hypothetical protein